MTKQTEALKLALEALNMTDAECGSRAWEREHEAIIAIREALALVNKVDQEQPDQPSKPWAGLTTADLDEIDAPIRKRGSATIAELYRAIEAKLREKNA